MHPTTEPVGLVVLTLEFRKEGRLWLGHCRELGTATDGRSLERVKDELIELVTLHLNTLQEVGERERFFKEHGIQLYELERAPREVQATVRLDDGAPLIQIARLRVTGHEFQPA